MAMKWNESSASSSGPAPYPSLLSCELCKRSAASSSALIMSLMTKPHSQSPACERHLLDGDRNQGAGELCADTSECRMVSLNFS